MEPKYWAWEKSEQLSPEVGRLRQKKTFPREMIVSDYPDFPKNRSYKLKVFAEVTSFKYCFLTRGGLPGVFIGYKYAKEIDK